MHSNSRPAALTDDADGELPEPGQRWGSGAQSVLPYLTKSLRAKPASAVDPRDATRPGGRNPVFSDWPRRSQS
ncbi:hypothetical protein LZ009_03475 [Ramlibacter sp. XY19]|uniref:hypothetical protein n=1 Tax=Ramlibacter paludis TaxID=2908000 RepID=UPI0023DB2FA9|nr:hypothetical protein [Ramlibacter paludis]MCG2591832.1 hypothetical protein [Ramlibacter paludis]